MRGGYVSAIGNDELPRGNPMTAARPLMRSIPAFTPSLNDLVRSGAVVATSPPRLPISLAGRVGLSVAGEHGHEFPLNIDKRGAGDVDNYLMDCSPVERPRRFTRVVAGDRLAAVPANVESLAGKRKFAGLGLDLALADLLLVEVQTERARGGHPVAFLLEPGGEPAVPGRDRPGGLDVLILDTDEVVVVLEFSVFDVERVAAEPAPMREEHA